MELLLTVHDAHFSYPALSGDEPIPVLRGVDLRISAGEWVAVVGANGSGKTTLARCLNGLLVPQRGVVRVNGLSTRDRNSLGAIRQKVGMVFQHPEDQVIATTVEEDIAFGPENLGLPATEIRARVEEALEAVGLEEHRRRPPHLLSAGQMQRLALGGALAMRPGLVVFDEATTMLDPAGRKTALRLMRCLVDEGIGVVFVTHHMEEAAQATRLVAMSSGRIVFDGTPRQFFSDRQRVKDLGLDLPPAMILAERIPGLESGAILDEQDLLQRLPAWQGQMLGLLPGRKSPQSESLVIEGEGIDHIYLKGTPLAQVALTGAGLRVAAGRAHGLLGRTGSGKSTLLQHLNGLLRPQTGRLKVLDMLLEGERPATREVVRRVGLVFQNPEIQFFESYVGDEISYGPRQFTGKDGLRERVQHAMEAVGLDFEGFKDRRTFSLSGGEKRKVALASALAGAPELLLLDEPTAGLDPASRRELLSTLRGMQKRGLQLVVSSHRMDDLAALADDLTVFARGKDVMRGSAGEVFARQSDLEALGLEAPLAYRVAERLRELGWPVEPADWAAHEPL